MSVNKTRGIIIVLSILALAASLAIENKMVALILMSICISGAVFILYRHLGELTDISADNPKMKTLKGVTIFNIAVLVVCVLAAFNWYGYLEDFRKWRKVFCGNNCRCGDFLLRQYSS